MPPHRGVARLEYQAVRLREISKATKEAAENGTGQPITIELDLIHQETGEEKPVVLPLWDFLEVMAMGIEKGLAEAREDGVL